jgi:hypothetical protein
MSPSSWHPRCSAAEGARDPAPTTPEHVHHGPVDHRRVHQLRRLRARVPEPGDLDGRGDLRDRPARCTECVGHFDEPQCVQLCPVACIPVNPARRDAEQLLAGEVRALQARPRCSQARRAAVAAARCPSGRCAFARFGGDSRSGRAPAVAAIGRRACRPAAPRPVALARLGLGAPDARRARRPPGQRSRARARPAPRRAAASAALHRAAVGAGAVAVARGRRAAAPDPGPCAGRRQPPAGQKTSISHNGRERQASWLGSPGGVVRSARGGAAGGFGRGGLGRGGWRGSSRPAPVHVAGQQQSAASSVRSMGARWPRGGRARASSARSHHLGLHARVADAQAQPPVVGVPSWAWMSFSPLCPARCRRA